MYLLLATAAAVGSGPAVVESEWVLMTDMEVPPVERVAPAVTVRDMPEVARSREIARPVETVATVPAMAPPAVPAVPKPVQLAAVDMKRVRAIDVAARPPAVPTAIAAIPDPVIPPLVPQPVHIVRSAVTVPLREEEGTPASGAPAILVPTVPEQPAIRPPEPQMTPATGPMGAARSCTDGSCEFSLSAHDMVVAAEQMVLSKNYEGAKPLVAALGMADGYELQYRFLSGMIAMGTGDFPDAERMFRKILDDSPGQTRVRLELAKTMLLMGKNGAADYHLRLAQNDDELPEDIRRTVSATRGILRGKRNWRFSFDVGLAPDTNINNGSSAETVDINFGPFSLPLDLNDDAKSKTGIGQTGSYSAAIRVGLKGDTKLLVESDARLLNYKGSDSDDFDVSLAAGPEFSLGGGTRLSAQALGNYRWYGGDLATREFGMRLDLQHYLSDGQRIGLRFDGRRSLSGYGDEYSGWKYSAAASYERVIGRSFIASGGLFGQRASISDDGYAHWALGLNAGIGGELPLGFNAGLSGSISRAFYDAPIQIYSNDERAEWRYAARAYLGLRKMRFMGFSPSVDYIYTRTDSNYSLYQSDRHRVNFKFSRYF